jgi:hypothetical protein
MMMMVELCNEEDMHTHTNTDNHYYDDSKMIKFILVLYRMSIEQRFVHHNS